MIDSKWTPRPIAPGASRSAIKCCFASFCLMIMLAISTVSKFQEQATHFETKAKTPFEDSGKLYYPNNVHVISSKSYKLLYPANKRDSNIKPEPKLKLWDEPTNSHDSVSDGFPLEYHKRHILWLDKSSQGNEITYNLSRVSKLFGDKKSDDNKECDDVHNVNSSEVCDFVRNNPDCQMSEGFISYTDIVYCQFKEKMLPLGITLLIFWWLFLFVGLAVTADDFFCPSLKVISKTLRLSDNVAGVTFLAFGNGAPDIFSAIAAISNAKNGDAGLAFGALLGAGVFVTSVVAGTIAVICPFDAMKRPFLRDVIFYLASVLWAFWVLWDKVIEQYEAIGFIVLYVIYVIVVVCGRYVYQRHKRFKQLQDNEKKEPQPDEDNNDASEDDDGPYTQSLEVPPDTEELSSPITGSASFFQNKSSDDIRTEAHIQADMSTERSTDDESLPLLGHRPTTTCTQRMLPLVAAIKAINPIDVAGWKEKKIYAKVFEIFKCPIYLLLLVTVPVVDEERDNHNWCRYLQVFQLMSGSMLSAVATKVGFKVLFGVFPVWALILVISVILSVIVLCTSNNDNKPVYHSVFGFIGFVVSVVWIYCIANEVVNILQTFGVVFNMSDAVLGLTLLAWGNSVGDFIADTVMARQGYPRMGISACFGGPMFNLLLGIGLPFTIQTIKTGENFKLQVTLQEYVLAGFLALSLLTSLFVVTFSRFRMSRPYGIILWVLYAIFLTVAILTESGIIHAEV